MDSKIIHVNPNSKLVQKLHQHDDGSMTLQTIHDETKVVEQNKSIHNMWSSLDRWGDGKVVLKNVPLDLIDEWKKKGWFTKEYFHKCLADPRATKYKVFGK